MNPAIGVCYYPEHWPEEQWEADARQMAEVGMSVVEEAELPTLALPAGVRCRVRDGFRIYFNYANANAVLTPAADEAGYVVGGAEIPAAGVTVARLATAG